VSLGQVARRFLSGLTSAPLAGSAAILVLFWIGSLAILGTSGVRLNNEQVVSRVARMAVEVFFLQLGLGLVLGLAATAIVRAWEEALGPTTRGRRWLAVFYLVFAVELWRIAAGVVAWPQLYIAFFWNEHGLLRALQVWLVAHLPRATVDLAGVAVLGATALGPFAFARARSWLASLLPWRRLAPVPVALLALALAPGLLASAPVPGDETRPNILVIGLESVRADRLVPERAAIAPNMARLAARGVRFETARVEVGRTYSSMMSFATGRSSLSHGIRHMFPSRARWAATGPTLFDALRERGYGTAFLTDASTPFVEPARVGLDEVKGPRGNHVDHLIRSLVFGSQLALLPWLEHGFTRRLLPELDLDWAKADPDLLADRTIAALGARARGGPFFLYAFFGGTHVPYTASRDHLPVKSDYRGPYPYGVTPMLRRGYAASEAGRVAELYDASITTVDAAVGRVLEALERSGVAKRTIVVLLADHGECLGEFDLGLGHGNHLRGEHSNAFPLVVFDPVHAVTPHAVPGLVRELDLAPTLAKLAGARLGPVDGVDLGPLLRGEKDDLGLEAYEETELPFGLTGVAPDDELRLPMFPDYLSVDEGGDVVLDPRVEELLVAAKHRALRKGRFKLSYVPTRRGPRWALFDVVLDPGETRDVAAERPELFQELRERLLALATRDGSVVENGLVVPRRGMDLSPPRE
jgi:arylsulfatase A-like enzyme